MTKIEVETTFPLVNLFSDLRAWAVMYPVDELSNNTKLQVLHLIDSTSVFALAFRKMPRYDVFNHLLVEVKTKMIDGKPFCKDFPLLCRWFKRRAMVLRLYKFHRAR